MTNPSNTVRKANSAPNLRERANRLRDASGRFIRHAAAKSDTGTSVRAQAKPPVGTVPAPIGAHPDAYALSVDANGPGAGLRCPPGSSVIVEPLSPGGAGLAVLYRKGGGAEIWDVTHNFVPGMFDLCEGSTVTPLVELIAPESGRRGHLDARSIEKAHRVIGVYVPAEIMEKYRPLPPDLPVMANCPEGMVTHFEDCGAAYPLVRHGETVVVDPSQREPVHGALCLLEWNSGSRSVLLTNLRTVGGIPPSWWVDPVNRPANHEAMERLQKRGGMLFASDGPYPLHHLREKIVGTVIGILVPGRRRQAAPSTVVASDPLPDVVQTGDAR